MNRRELIKRISTRADEFIVDSSLLGGSTASENPLEVIESELDYSALFVLENAVEEILHPVIKSNIKHHQGQYANNCDTRVEISECGDVIVVAPSDFLRLVSLKLASWPRDIKRIGRQSDIAYQNAKGSKYASGSIYDPIGFLTSFAEYEVKLVGTITDAPAVGESVFGTGGVSGSDPVTGTVKEIGDDFIILKDVVGSFDTLASSRGHYTLEGDVTGEIIAEITEISDEINRYRVLKTLDANVALVDLFNGETVDGLALTTGDIVSLPEQTTFSEVGIYQIGADANSIKKLTSRVYHNLPNQAIECFKGCSDDTIEKLHYVPDISEAPERFPAKLLDALIDVGAARLLKYLRKFDESALAQQSAEFKLSGKKYGLITDP